MVAYLIFELVEGGSVDEESPSDDAMTVWRVPVLGAATSLSSLYWLGQCVKLIFGLLRIGEALSGVVACDELDKMAGVAGRHLRATLS